MKNIEAQLQTEPVGRLWRWWSNTARQLGRPPRREEIDPAGFIPALRMVWLVEWVAEKDSFRYRLAGEAVSRTSGVLLRGRMIEEVLPPEIRASTVDAWREAVARPAVAYQYGMLYPSEETALLGERLVLPILGRSGSDAHYLLGATAHVHGRAQEDAFVRPLAPVADYAFHPVKDLLARTA